MSEHSRRFNEFASACGRKHGLALAMQSGFTIEQPGTLDEALDLLATDDPGIRPIAGGTGLTPLMKYAFFQPTTLVSLRRLVPAMSGVERADDGGFRLGAMTTLRRLEESSELARDMPVLAQALHVLATVRVRNVAQLGGAIAHGHPQMDLPPVLMALGARVLARSRRGERWIDADDLFLGYYETALAGDELITEVVLPPLGEHRGLYRKFTERTVDDWPMLGIAAVAGMESGSLTRLRVSLGAIGDRPVRLHDLEAALTLGELSPDGLRAIARDVADGISFQDRPFGSAAYQRQLVGVHLQRTLETLLLGEDQGGRS